jgi:hypothetical protein
MLSTCNKNDTASVVVRVAVGERSAANKTRLKRKKKKRWVGDTILLFAHKVFDRMPGWKHQQ